MSHSEEEATGSSTQSNPNPNPNPNLKMVCGSFYIPKKNPKKPLGEDAFFVCHDREVIGVADGVGGWAKYGIDSG